MKNRNGDQVESEEEIAEYNDEVVDLQGKPPMTAEELEDEELACLPVIHRSEMSPIAVKFLKRKANRRENSAFEEKSIKIKCPYCDAVSNSIIEYKPSLIGYLLMTLAMLVFGIIGIVLLPFVVNLTKLSLHRCAKCLNEVKERSYFTAQMDDKLWSI